MGLPHRSFFSRMMCNLAPHSCVFKTNRVLADLLRFELSVACR
jgi:hypothetical protein